MILVTVLSYSTRRHHQIKCESKDILIDICAERFRYTPIWNHNELFYEPNWAILKYEELN